MTENRETKRKKLGCMIVALSLIVIALVVVFTIAFAVNRALTSFDAYRGRLCVREGISVSDEKLRFSPGMDSVIYCRFTVVASSIEEVFDENKVDADQFNDEDYQGLKVEWIENDWWDIERSPLTGGEVEINGDWLRVGFRDNGDGTLTVYIFWFQV